MNRTGGLDLPEDMRFQRKEWAVAKWGWFVMLVIIVAALLGLFGNGLLSDTAAASGPLRVRYGRFERAFAESEYVIQLEGQQTETHLQVDRGLLSHYTVLRIFPEPDSVLASTDHVTYVFRIEEGEQPVDFVFTLQGNFIGAATGDIGVVGGPSVRVRQFIYP